LVKIANYRIQTVGFLADESQLALASKGLLKQKGNDALMILWYGFSINGSSHIKKGVKCQDANKVIKLDNGLVIAAIADGVGSCKYSDVAALIAVNLSV